MYQQLKNIYHFFQAHFWRAVYGFPDTAMTVFGVTGTNGKTTTCFVLAGILAAARGEARVGMLSTVEIRIGSKKEFNKTKLTTLPSRLVYRYIRDMRREGVTQVVVEMTSHALHQHRLAGLKLDGAIILNVAREHLDYHHTMTEYAAAKEKIIDYLKPDAPLIGKADDVLIAKILERARERGVTVIPFTAAEASRVSTPLSGDVNKQNVLAATLLARTVGVNEEVIQKGIAATRAVPGRNEWFDLPGGAQVVIDYAVTPDALLQLYQQVRQAATRRILAILGAAGLRDRGKRPDMARAVAQYADVLVITNEDPWTEPEEQIFADLEKGLKNPSPSPFPYQGRGEDLNSLDKGSRPERSRRPEGFSWQRIPDRKEALRFLIRQAQPGDVIVATGKGAERGMGIGKTIIPWNEREIIEELAKEK